MPTSATLQRAASRETDILRHWQISTPRLRPRWAAWLCALAVIALPAAAQSVAFIDPGKSDEIYWVTAARAMQAAAKSLGMRLEVQYAERDHLRTIEIARSIAARPAAARPDYVIITNDNGTGLEQLRVLDAAGIRTLFAYSTIPPSDRREIGGPRERYRHWLGSIEPHAEQAGELTARALLAAARSGRTPAATGKLQVVVLAGDRATPSSTRRDAGMMSVFAADPDVEVMQVVYAGWSREKAEEQAEWLFGRYPEARIVWAANDLMAFGAMRAWEKRGGHPGGDAWFSGINTSPEALKDVTSGRLSALAGGHFIAGAWALVMLSDYARGRDFASEGLDLDRPMFTLFDAGKAARFTQLYGENFERIDFRRYSKALNPRLRRYDFDFAQLLR